MTLAIWVNSYLKAKELSDGRNCQEDAKRRHTWFWWKLKDGQKRYTRLKEMSISPRKLLPIHLSVVLDKGSQMGRCLASFEHRAESDLSWRETGVALLGYLRRTPSSWWVTTAEPEARKPRFCIAIIAEPCQTNAAPLRHYPTDVPTGIERRNRMEITEEIHQ